VGRNIQRAAVNFTANLLRMAFRRARRGPDAHLMLAVFGHRISACRRRARWKGEIASRTAGRTRSRPEYVYWDAFSLSILDSGEITGGVDNCQHFFVPAFIFHQPQAE